MNTMIAFELTISVSRMTGTLRFLLGRWKGLLPSATNEEAHL